MPSIRSSCTQCGKALSEGHKFCGSCGHQVELAAPHSLGLSGPSGLNSLSGTGLDNLTARLNDRVEQTRSRLHSRIADLGSESSPLFRSNALTNLVDGPSSLVHQSEVWDLAIAHEEDIDGAKYEVWNSRHVQTNSHYAERASATTFAYDAGDSNVNAFASEGPYSLSNGKKLPAPCVVFLGGLANVISVVSVALGVHLALNRPGRIGITVSPLIPAFKETSRVLISRGQFTQQSAKEVLGSMMSGVHGQLRSASDEDFVVRARSFRMSMYKAVIAHEMGHIAYSHTEGGKLSYEISRDREFDADSFARQVLSSCQYAEYNQHAGPDKLKVFLPVCKHQHKACYGCYKEQQAPEVKKQECKWPDEFYCVIPGKK